MIDALSIDVLILGGDRSPPRTVKLRRGAQLRELLIGLGYHAEGSAVWWNGEPVPMDFTPPGPGTLEIVSTFSGG